MDRMTTAEATVAALIAHGIETIYALPGVHNDPLFDALFKASDRIRTVHTRHEQGAGYMALGAALATGKPQAYTVVPGPGLLNSATGAAHRPRHQCAGAGADRPDRAGRDRPRLRPPARDSRPGRHLFAPRRFLTHASARRPRRPGWSQPQCAPCEPAGPDPPCSNARSTCGAAAGQCRDRTASCRCPPPIDEDAVAEPPSGSARRRVPDRRRRRRAGCRREVTELSRCCRRR